MPHERSASPWVHHDSRELEVPCRSRIGEVLQHSCCRHEIELSALVFDGCDSNVSAEEAPAVRSS